MTAVLVATITGTFAVLVALVERTRRQNHREHGETTERIDWLLRGMGRIEHKIDKHIYDHERGRDA